MAKNGKGGKRISEQVRAISQLTTTFRITGLRVQSGFYLVIASYFL